MPYVTALADFREEVRKIALEENSRLLCIPGRLRDCGMYILAHYRKL